MIPTHPQKLYDVIYELTFTTDSADVIVRGGLRPPARLHVNSASRKLLETRYYQDTILYSHEYRSETLIHWLHSLPAQQRELLSHIRWDRQPEPDDPLEHVIALTYVKEQVEA